MGKENSEGFIEKLRTRLLTFQIQKGKSINEHPRVMLLVQWRHIRLAQTRGSEVKDKHTGQLEPYQCLGALLQGSGSRA